jgi:virulence-associated protein VagC
MPTTAKVFWSGNSQAVRLPREFRFPEGTGAVLVRREGKRLVIEPVTPAKFSRRFWQALGSLPAFRRPAQTRQRRRQFPR